MCHQPLQIFLSMHILLTRFYTYLSELPLPLMELNGSFSSTVCLLWLMDYIPHPILLCLIILSSFLIIIILLLFLSLIIIVIGWLYYSTITRLISLNITLYGYLTRNNSSRYTNNHQSRMYMDTLNNHKSLPNSPNKVLTKRPSFAKKSNSPSEIPSLQITRPVKTIPPITNGIQGPHPKEQESTATLRRRYLPLQERLEAYARAAKQAGISTSDYINSRVNPYDQIPNITPPPREEEHSITNGHAEMDEHTISD